MDISAICLVDEEISDKSKAFDSSGVPLLEVTLLNLSKTGITDGSNLLAKINYIQSSTGLCDYILQLESKNIEDLMKAVNFIRNTPLVKEIQTSIGLAIFKN